MREQKKLRLLFIGNSLTYVQDLPELVANRFRADGFDCEVTMIAHGGWTLQQHLKEPDVRFNIRYGHYDYVILQEYSHPFVSREQYLDAVQTLHAWIREAGAKTVLYGTWSLQDEPEQQSEMDRIHREAAQNIRAILAPVGELWWPYQRAHSAINMYCEDREHASIAGADFAAECIWRAVGEHIMLSHESKRDRS
jgi:hypothetical protein